ncbi:MAG: protein-glutamate O-methyltransferase CheR [Bacteroidia bacterium]
MKDKIDIEVQLVVDAIYQGYGYDFREYKPATIKNRLEGIKNEYGYNHISDLIPKIIHDRSFFESLYLAMSVTVTEMFRDPKVYIKFRELIMPTLKTYPFVNIWHAGCATGEEVYSMAILLKEAGMLHRSQLYATDINNHSLAIAEKGIYSIEEMKSNIENYNKIKGSGEMGDYYHARYKGAKMDESLKERITFSIHNLATDWVFAETQLIVCRNVLIYFNNQLKERVIQLFADSLCHHGYLCLGSHESLDFSKAKAQFEIVDKDAKIYRKI